MRAKSERRLHAEALRREQGLSYKEIEALTGINRSTLSGWLRDLSLAPAQEARLQARLVANRAGFAARALPINRQRHAHARQAAFQAGAAVSCSLGDDRALHELALAMLYAGEGSKRSGVVQLANMDPNILRYFMWALTHLYAVDQRRLTFRLSIYGPMVPAVLTRYGATPAGFWNCAPPTFEYYSDPQSNFMVAESAALPPVG